MRGEHFLDVVLPADGCVGLRIAGTQVWLATEARVAGTSATRRAGLLGASSMRHGEALILAPTQGVHTFGMRFPLDIVGVRRDGTVVSLRESVPRRRLVFSLRAFAMVEMAAGAVGRAGLRRGDRLEVAVPSDSNAGTFVISE